MNFFVEYHAKSDIDGHFGLIQKIFKTYERKRDILSLEGLLWCFEDYFTKVNTEVSFEVYENLERPKIVQKLTAKDFKAYMSLKGNGDNVLGSSTSSFNYNCYKNVDYTIVYSKEKRRNKYAPKMKCKDQWDISRYKMRVMGTRVALGT